nr:hypothetical protein [Tanacetum cinerariifolium]
QDKVAQALEITKLKQRVRKLEKKRKFKHSGLKRLRKVGTTYRVESSIDIVVDDQEDGSKQRGKIDELDVDEDVTLVDVDAEVEMDTNIQGRMAESQAKAYNLDLQHYEKVLSMQDTNEAEPTKVEEVLEASALRKRRGVVIQDPEQTAAASVIVHLGVQSKDKGKGILIEEPKPLKVQAHIDLDEAFARQVEEEVTVQENEIEEEGSKRKGKSLEQKIAKKQRMDKEAEELKIHLQIVANDDDDDVYIEATPLASKKLVKEIFESIEPKNFSDDFLLNTLRIMFEKPNVEANMFLLVEKKYPLTHFTLAQMLNNVRLEVEEESEISLELSRLTKWKLKIPAKYEDHVTDIRNGRSQLDYIDVNTGIDVDACCVIRDLGSSGMGNVCEEALERNNGMFGNQDNSHPPRNTGCNRSNSVNAEYTIVCESTDDTKIVNDEERIRQRIMSEDSMNFIIDDEPWLVRNKLLVVQKWDLNLDMEVTKPKSIPLWVKLLNVVMKAWTVREISTHFKLSRESNNHGCCYYFFMSNGSGRFSYARVLVGMSVKKEFPEEIEICYRDKKDNTIGLKKVNIVYAWKPPTCKHCEVFGHNDSNCTVKPISVEEFVDRERKLNLAKSKENRRNKTWEEKADVMKDVLDEETKIGMNMASKEHKSLYYDVLKNEVVGVDVIGSNIKFFLTIFYAFSSGKERQKLYKELKCHNIISNGKPLTFMGDFNVTLKSDEHSAGSAFSTNDMIDSKTASMMLKL